MEKVNKLYQPLFIPPPGVRYIINMGGRGGGRSHAAAQKAKTVLTDPSKYLRGAMMRYIYGDIKNSIYQDIYDRIDEADMLDDIDLHGQPLGFSYKKNRINGIGFKKSSGDQKSKLKSLAGYNFILIEEADEIAETDFMQLDDSIRTTKGDILIVLNLNPPEKDHWIIKRWFNLIDTEIEGFYEPVLKEEHKHNTIHIHATYYDNIVNIDPTTASNFEGYRESKPEYYWNTIRGYVSEGAVGRIYKNWKPTTYAEFKELPYPSIYGLDFGFSNDPAALVEIKMHNNKIWVHQLLYQTGLHNIGAGPDTLSKRFEDLDLSGQDLIYADSAEIKSIEELCGDGWYVEPAVKGPGSVNAGIDLLQGFEVYYTEESVDIARESREYKYRLDRNKVPTGKPEDGNDHALDAIRYAVFSHRQSTFVGFAGK
jgi:phage terminase large subunit